MIIVKITGGLGNQLFQYAIGRALSIKLNCELVLDVSFYPLQSLRKYELEKFHIKARLASKAEINSAGGGDHFIARFIRKLGVAPFFYPDYIKEIESIRYVKAIDSCKTGSYLDGYWQNPAYFKSFKEELCDDLSPIEPISLSAEKRLEKIKDTDSVSLHVRRGDYVQNVHTNGVHGVCSLDYYRNAIRLIQQEIPDPIFYIFSDDIDWCKSNLSFVENAIFIDDTESEIDDLILMQHCKANIIANSTFSWWGAWLNPIQCWQVAPENWFSSQSRNSIEVYPESWLIL